MVRQMSHTDTSQCNASLRRTTGRDMFVEHADASGRDAEHVSLVGNNERGGEPNPDIEPAAGTNDFQIPATLRRLKYIDWRAESNSARQQLLAALRPDTPPPGGGSVSQFVTQVTGRAAPVDTEFAVDQLGEWVASNARSGLRPVLIDYEVEQLVVEFLPQFFARIRGMLERVMVVLCSRSELDLMYRDRGLTSAFHNTLALVCRVAR